MTATWRVRTYLAGALIGIAVMLVGLFALEVNPFASALILLAAMALLLFALSKLCTQANGFKSQICRTNIKENSYGG